MKHATAERNEGNPNGTRPVGDPGGPARDAEAAVVPVAAITPGPPPAAIAVCGARACIDVRYRAGEYWVNPQTLSCEAVLGAGDSLEEAMVRAVRKAVEGLEEMRRGG